jgi:phage terminase large subunit-like protein
MDRDDSLRTDFVSEYAQAVVDGVIIAGPHVRDACKRHLKDLIEAPERGFFFDLDKAIRVVEFFQEVLYLNGGDFEGVPFDPLPWQKFILGSLFGWVNADGKRRFRMAFVLTGKGPLALDTPIATVNGWSTMGQLKIGDYVFDDQGKPTKVVGVSDIFYQRDCYKLTFSDGYSIVADAAHRWPTRSYREKGRVRHKTTFEIAGSVQAWRLGCNKLVNHHIAVAPALELPIVDLPVPPYTFGAWLGDGDSDSARITVHRDDWGVVEQIILDGVKVKEQRRHSEKVARVSFMDGNGRRNLARRIAEFVLGCETFTAAIVASAAVSDIDRTSLFLSTSGYFERVGEPARFGTGGREPQVWRVAPGSDVELRRLADGTPVKQRLQALGVLGNKHIPPIYLRASREQRLSLLQGIMDTDGSVTLGGKCEITLCSKPLIDGVQELLHSLGYKCVIRESAAKLNGKEVGRRWRIGFQAYLDQPIFRLQRKAERLCDRPSKGIRSFSRAIIGCESVPSVPVKCITVDAESHLFLAGKSLILSANSGKSPLCAGLGMYGLMADGEARAEIYAGAAKKEQAMILFRDAVAMAELSPELSTRLIKSGRGEEAWNLAYPETGSYFRPVSSDDKKSGNRPHFALLDEIHEHKNSTVIEMMRAGTKGRRQALIFMITNAGHDRTSVCWNYHDYATKIASGQLEDDSFFSYVCALDENEDPFIDENCWIKVNPSLGVTIQRQYIEEQVTQARGMPSKESVVRRLNFCQWVGAESPWISSDVWFDTRENYPPEQLYGRRCFGGLDLSSTQDLTALILLFEPTNDDPNWRLLPYFWLPALGLDEKGRRDGVDYLTWVRQGHLETTPGAAIDKAFVLKRLAEIAADYDLQSVGYDRWRIEDLKNMADNDGIDIDFQPFGQGFKDMAPAVDEFETRLLARQLKHDGNPVMTWCAANAVVATDPAGNRKPTKQKSTGRIDGVVAAVMAVGQTLGADKGNIDDFLNDPVMSAA